jgi:glycosyltransferase involved in cell wall biosynthesis
MRTGIVIALNNKEKEISPIKIEQILEANKSVHICFVNNGSTDRTLEVLNSFKEKFTDRLSVVSIKNNKGIDSALKVGFRFLLNTMDFSNISFSTHIDTKKINLISNFQNEMLVLE